VLIALSGWHIKQDKYFMVCSCCLYGADIKCILELELTTTVQQRGVLPVFLLSCVTMAVDTEHSRKVVSIAANVLQMACILPAMQRFF